ncbi:hypothetical protein SESBI_36915, partial [Sesbania bispinosa]
LRWLRSWPRFRRERGGWSRTASSTTTRERWLRDKELEVGALRKEGDVAVEKGMG